MNQEIIKELNKENLNVFEKIKCFFLNPKLFFKNNEKKNPWIIPFLLIVVSTAVLQGKAISIVTSGIDMGTEGGQDTTAIVGKISMVFGAISGTLGSIITILASSLVILLCVKYILKGNIFYKQVLSIYCFSNIPNIILNFINLAIYKQANSSIITADFMTILVKKINPLTIWFVILLIIGISVVAKISVKKSAILFIIFTFLSITFTIGSYLVTEGMQHNINDMQFEDIK